MLSKRIRARGTVITLSALENSGFFMAVPFCHMLVKGASASSNVIALSALFFIAVEVLKAVISLPVFSEGLEAISNVIARNALVVFFKTARDTFSGCFAIP